jgi:hypothetical protein
MKKKIKNLICRFSEEIEFPDICVFCGKENPDSTTSLSPTEDENGANDRMVVFAVPSCGSCAYAQKDRDRQIANLVFTLFLVLFTSVAAWMLKAYYSFIYVAIAVFLIALFSSVSALRGIKKAITIESLDSDTITFGLNQKKYRDLFVNMNQNLFCNLSEGQDSD